MIFLLIYLIGVFLSIALFFIFAIKKWVQITIGDVTIFLIISLGSWVSFIALLVCNINWNKVIWRRKE